MEANYDEAARCLKIAEKHLAQKDIASARRFILKAQKLYPKIDVSKYSSFFDQSQFKQKSRSASRERDLPKQDRPNSPVFTKAKSEAKTFSKTGADPIRKILATKDHYQVLGVTKTATNDEIKRAYKLLALKYHPDKNQNPGAVEVFKKIGQSLEILTDPVKRKRFDEFGNEDEAPNVIRRRGGDVFYQYETHQGFDADIFNMFFNGGFPFGQFNQARQHRRRETYSNEPERETNYFVYLQLLPLIILFALSFFSSMVVRDPYFNLQRTQKYPIERTTHSYNVPYFVKTTFETDFDGSLPQLERQIEEEYVNALRFKCYREKEAKEAMLYRARYFNDEDAFIRAQRTPVPSCDRLNTYFNHG